MSDKAILKEARDALNKEHGKIAAIADSHPNLVLIPKSPSDCEVCQLILRLDTELAKVAEPVDEEREIVVLRSVIGARKDAGLSSDTIARAVWQAGYRLPCQPVVLDLSGVFLRTPGGGSIASQTDLLAAIRAQLPGVEVRL